MPAAVDARAVALCSRYRLARNEVHGAQRPCAALRGAAARPRWLEWAAAPSWTSRRISAVNHEPSRLVTSGLAAPSGSAVALDDLPGPRTERRPGHPLPAAGVRRASRRPHEEARRPGSPSPAAPTLATPGSGVGIIKTRPVPRSAPRRAGRPLR